MDRAQKHILVAVDGSDSSLEVVRYLGRLLPKGRVNIDLFHVMDLLPESLWDLESSIEQGCRGEGFENWEFQHKFVINGFMENAKQLLVGMGYGDNEITINVRDRDVNTVRDIAQEVQHGGYAALVIGRSKINLMKALILGSTSTRLVELLRLLPVWIVGGSPNPGKVLIAMDNSEEAERAMNYVVDLLHDDYTEVLLFHVSRKDSRIHHNVGHLLSFQEGRNWSDRLRNEVGMSEGGMKTCLQNHIDQLAHKGIDRNRIHSKIVDEADSRSEAIIREAFDGDYGTIVLGRRNLSKMDEFIRSRVSNKVIDMAQEKAVWVVN